MYLRTIQRRNKDGSVVRYLQLAHNRRKGASTQAEVLVSLGREDRLDVEGLRRLVGSIGRYLDGTRGLPAASPLAAGGASGLVVESSRPIGATWLLDQLGVGPPNAWQILLVQGVLAVSALLAAFDPRAVQAFQPGAVADAFGHEIAQAHVADAESAPAGQRVVVRIGSRRSARVRRDLVARRRARAVRRARASQ